MRIHDLAGKHVAIWGSGREAAATVRALHRLHIEADVHVLDENLTEGATVEGIPVESFDGQALRNADVVVRSPGISKYRSELEDCTVTTATNLWFAEPHSPVIAFTGTKGKSTSSSLTAHLLNAIGQTATLAGNIGRSPLDMLGEPEPQWWVLELSSFQTSDLEGHPFVAAMTSFSPEHLDWHGDVEAYLRDKSRLLELAERVVVNPIDDVTRALLDRFPDATAASTDEDVPESNLLGPHNRQLVRLVLAVLRTAGVDVDAQRERLTEGLRTFEPLPHRLEPVGEVNGVLFINDSLSTTPVATMAAIAAVGDRPVTVLVGGYDRGVDYHDLGAFIRDRGNVRVVALGANGGRIAEAIDDAEQVTRVEPFDEAVGVAAAMTPEGGVVLLSPAAPSFDQFVDYAARGRRFAELATELAQKIATGKR